MAIYIVGREGADEGEKPRMIEARTAASAVAHAARTAYSAVAISAKQTIAYTKQGIELETAGEAVPTE